MEWKVTQLRYAGTCCRCGDSLMQGARAQWDASQKVVRCLECVEGRSEAARVDQLADPFSGPHIDKGSAGASAQAEFERRSQRARAGAQHVQAWSVGARGETLLGATLDNAEGCRVLHDRRVPGTRANVDHIAVAATGVWVIDAKKYTGKIEHRVGAGFSAELRVGGHNRTNLVEGVIRQVDLVRSVMHDDTVPVHGVICFVQAETSLFGLPFTVSGVQVHKSRTLIRRLERKGDVSFADRTNIASQLSEALPAYEAG